MSQPDAHTVRNAVIATVVGGIILAGLGLLWPPAKEALGVVKSTALYMWQMLFTDYSVPGWSLLAVALMAVAALVQFVLIFRKVVLSSAEPSYTQDNIHGAKWHWVWKDREIRGLWASCPSCHGELVYVHDKDLDFLTVPRARYLCENCNKIVAVIEGGGHDYAVSAVQREIRRRLRAGHPSVPGSAS